MIVVTIELHQKGDPARAKILGRMFIVNDGTSTKTNRGNYLCVVNRKGRNGTSVFRTPDGTAGWRSPAQRVAHVKDFPRESYSVWRLVLRALRACYPEEKG